MKRVLLASILAMVLSVGLSQKANAIASVTDPSLPSALASSQIVVSAVPIGKNPGFIELYNRSDAPVSMEGLVVTLVLVDGAVGYEVPIHLPAVYLLTDSYMTIGQAGLVDQPDATFTIPANMTNATLKSVALTDSVGHEELQLTDIAATASKYIWAQRKTGDSGLGTTMANMTQKEAPITLRGKGTYSLPTAPPAVRIVEILASHASCAPNDISLTCQDYIKLYNPTDAALDLSAYRLRTDSGTSVSGNAFSLNYLLPAKSYLTIAVRDDGAPISVTNDGGYVWLEDAEGIVKYNETIVSYVDATSMTKQGWSWALYLDGTWGWTSTPQPDSANVITILVDIIAATATVDSLCPAGKYRNPETNRCRAIEEAIATLVSCDEGQERNPATNRCRSLVTVASATLTPCDPDQERNPATNRCRALGTSTALGPCPEGQERSPDTNRCRKVVPSLAAATFAEPSGDKNLFSSYWFGGAVAVAAAGYGTYEWRSELMKLFRKIVPAAK